MNTLPDNLPIVPFTRPVRGSVTLPGSKSITNRALLLAALGNGSVTLTNALFSEDTRIMAEALRQLGINVVENEVEKTIIVHGRDGQIPAEHAELFVGNAGTAARFLTALCAAAPHGVFKIDGVPQMRKRPMKGLIIALRDQGAKITCVEKEGFFPITIESDGLKGGRVDIDANESSQMLSALLMVAPMAREIMWIKSIGKVRVPFVTMTGRLATEFTRLGFNFDPTSGLYTAPILSPNARYRSPVFFKIEPDASAASYFLTLPLVVGGSLYLPGLRTAPNQTLQGDSAFASVLNNAGATVRDRKEPVPLEPDEAENYRTRSLGVDSEFNLSDLRKGVTQDFSEFSDTFLTLAAIAPLLEEKTTITGIAHTRKQETDRVAGVARELKKLGQHVIETEDSLEIHPRPLTTDVEIETYHDHRFAMSFAILGCHDLHGNGQPWLTIKDPACCSKTFPHFFDVLAKLRTESHQ